MICYSWFGAHIVEHTHDPCDTDMLIRAIRSLLTDRIKMEYHFDNICFGLDRLQRPPLVVGDFHALISVWRFIAYPLSLFDGGEPTALQAPVV